MPWYEYRCERCNVETEKQLGIKEANKKIYCPKCKKQMQKLISKGSFILKGSGWYSDGY